MSEYFIPIAELAKKLDVPAHTLRYWEKEFPNLIVPTTGAGGRRFYRKEIADNIFALKKYLYTDGYTIDGVKKLISNNAFAGAPTPTVTPTTKEPEDSKGIADAIILLEEAKKILG